MRILAAPDKMRGTLRAVDVAKAIADGAASASVEVDQCPLSDGGEGFSEMFGGQRHEVTVSGPLGEPVAAHFMATKSGAIVLEMSAAAGRSLLPHPQGDECLLATTRGVGELINAARDLKPSLIYVGCGGSATTDGGRGAVDVLSAQGGLDGTHVVVATDVTTKFLSAASDFAPQKGATPAQVALLTQRLQEDAGYYQETYGVDVTNQPRTGAAGGLAGGLYALGAELVSGFDLVAAHYGLATRVADADLVVTAEGRLDRSTLDGKTIDSLLHLVSASRPVLVVAGSIEEGVEPELRARHGTDLEFIDLSARFGVHAALHETAALVTRVVAATCINLSR